MHESKPQSGGFQIREIQGCHLVEPGRNIWIWSVLFRSALFYLPDRPRKSWHASWAPLPLPILALVLLQAHQPAAALPNFIHTILQKLSIFQTAWSSKGHSKGFSPPGGSLPAGTAEARFCRIRKPWRPQWPAALLVQSAQAPAASATGPNFSR